MCGKIADSCGQSQDCGDCANGATCGHAVQNTCDTPCTPTTCTDVNANCGYVSDGCGKFVYCGTCGTGEECGVTQEHVCGPTSPTSANPCADPAKGFCSQVADCSTASSSTILSGTVLAPNGTMPLPNAFVYVPNGSKTYPYGVTEFVDGVANNACSCDTSGDPLVSTTSAFDGSFSLAGVPAGTDIPLVIQLGRWRRVVTIPNVPACAQTMVPATLTSLPKRQDMGTTLDAIPLMALPTGGVDAIECVIRKMGVEDSQFSNGGGTGRVHFYLDNGAKCTTGGGSCTGTTPPLLPGTPRNANALMASQANVDKYDALIFPCDGTVHDVDAAYKSMVLDAASNMSAYVNKGGRAFFTHYSYGWLYNQPPSIQLPWISTATARANDGTHHDPTQQVQIDTSFPRGDTFAKWLGLASVNALSGTNPPRIAIDESREVVTNPTAWTNMTPIPALRWAFYYNNQPAADMLHVTFDTPWGLPATQQCGRVLYSAFHVTTAAISGSSCAAATGGGSANTSKCNFPEECSTTFTAQEKALAYFMFDMTSCVQPPEKHCVPKTCAERGVTCGTADDGCGAPLDCGNCTTCVPKTCTDICADSGQGCSATYDDKVFALECAKPTGCSSTVTCYCKIG